MTELAPQASAPPARSRRHSLRLRLATWMLLSTLFTLTAFAITVYAFIAIEAAEPPGADAIAEPDESPLEDAQEQVFEAMLAAAPLCIALSVGGALWLSRRALAPLDAVIGQTRAMTVEDLEHRLPVPERADELRDLAIVLNGMLERLQEGFDTLGSFAAAASHELRTPLAVMHSELEIALRRPRAPDEWERVARVSLDELRRLDELVGALLALARAGAPSSVQLEDVDLGERVEQALGSVAREAREAGVQLEAPRPEPGVLVRAQPDVLTSAIQELVRNAFRHAPQGSAVRVSLEGGAGEPTAALHVDDAGPGVPPAERDTVFEPFVRGERGRASERGLGLGLAIVKRGMERCGGSVRVERSPAGGARFTLTLPAARAS